MSSSLSLSLFLLDLYAASLFQYVLFTNGTFSYEAPEILSLTPETGAVYGGNIITIKGKNFGHQDSRRNTPPYIFVDDQLCINTVHKDDSTLECLVPSLSSELPRMSVTVNVKVMIGGVWVQGDPLQYTYQAVQITSISPNFGPVYGGSAVTVYGTNIGYLGAENFLQVYYYPLVYIGGAPCVGVVVSEIHVFLVHPFSLF